jgi:hypothetical protein
MNNMASEIKNTWQIISTESSSILELRALWPNGIEGKKPPISKIFRATTYPSIEECRTAFEDEALRLNAAGYNIYVVMNPIREDFAGRSAKDEDIAYRNLILIDIDKVGNTGLPSTEEEVEASRQLADEIVEYLTLEFTLPAPIRLMSGNGHHLYYILHDTPNTDVIKEMVRDFLRTLAKNYDNSKVKVDTSVFNASRITKVPGTIARKGIASNERPYRKACLYVR